ncbi:MAG: glycosyltransferase family 39 protein [Rhizobiales bacterium]|nr:glycosyltransferase family 39 protein [Hyphomicrobiales bacterium]MBO6698430.1 glycosyltransferase family 39 protein [Hyphomicrobiales bacterium]MBO6735316.1 glycosyltransferase family 39 protein [Hyphomicrobiales bacterium]MBO6910876.1 glycosyltransferase family 39 protein [Hyphomicrobiales bacterium]MBO6955932.1 glycosyltransferase family 39 protein [Hyphomicrobiales bacterium]
MTKRDFDPAITQDAAANAGLWVSPPDMSDETPLSGGPEAIQSAEADAPSQAAATPAPVVAPGQPASWSKWIPRWSWVDRWADGLTPIFDGLARLRIVAAVCIALVAVAAFTPGFTTIPPIDRDESRFSQATRQMVATGDYVEIRFQNDARYQKPIGIYWLQSAAVHLYGAEDGQAPIWVYRTVSFVGAVSAAVLVYWLALGFGAPPVAFAAGLLVAITVLLGAEARLAKTDAMLFATILVAQGILARAFLGRRDSSVKLWHAGLFWTAAAAGILIKGPILPMVVGSTALVAALFERRIAWLRRLRPGLGIMWMLILTLPWFIAIGITSGGEFYAQSIGRDLFEKIGQSRERPFVPPGAYTFGFFPSLGWPLAPLAFLAIPFAIASWRDKSTRFLVAWIVPTWAIFELSATKLPHYILPIYPALAILAARMMVYEKVPEGWLAGVAKGLFLLIPIAGTIGMPIVLYVYGDSISPVGVALMIIGLILLIGAFLLIIRQHARASLVLIVAGTLVLYSGAFGIHVPAARTIWVTPQLVTALDAVRCDEPELATLGYNEPSLVLMTRTDLRTLVSAEAAADFLAQGGCRAAFVDAPFVEDLFEALARLTPEESTSAATVRLLARVEGININGGDELNMHVFAAGE